MEKKLISGDKVAFIKESKFPELESERCTSKFFSFLNTFSFFTNSGIGAIYEASFDMKRVCL